MSKLHHRNAVTSSSGTLASSHSRPGSYMVSSGLPGAARSPVREFVHHHAGEGAADNRIRQADFGFLFRLPEAIEVRFGRLQVGLGVLEVVRRDDLLIEERPVPFIVGLGLSHRGFGAMHGLLRLFDPVAEITVVQHYESFPFCHPLARRNPHPEDVGHNPGSHRGDLFGLNRSDGFGGSGQGSSHNLVSDGARRGLLRNRLLGSLESLLGETSPVSTA